MITPEVAEAIDEIRAAFAPSPVTVEEVGDGGAHVVIETVELSTTYDQDSTWVGFDITFQYPLADVYPHFVRPDLTRRDQAPLGEATSPATYCGQPAIQLSRRSNHLNPATDTAALKALKVITWLNSR